MFHKKRFFSALALAFTLTLLFPLLSACGSSMPASPPAGIPAGGNNIDISGNWEGGLTFSRLETGDPDILDAIDDVNAMLADSVYPIAVRFALNGDKDGTAYITAPELLENSVTLQMELAVAKTAVSGACTVDEGTLTLKGRWARSGGESVFTGTLSLIDEYGELFYDVSLYEAGTGRLAEYVPPDVLNPRFDGLAFDSSHPLGGEWEGEFYISILEGENSTPYTEGFDLPCTAQITMYDGGVGKMELYCGDESGGFTDMVIVQEDDYLYSISGQYQGEPFAWTVEDYYADGGNIYGANEITHEGNIIYFWLDLYAEGYRDSEYYSGGGDFDGIDEPEYEVVDWNNYLVGVWMISPAAYDGSENFTVSFYEDGTVEAEYCTYSISGNWESETLASGSWYVDDYILNISWTRNYTDYDLPEDIANPIITITEYDCRMDVDGDGLYTYEWIGYWD